MNKFTVDRATWLRGKSSGKESRLLDNEGHKCCVGFQCLAAGMAEMHILDVDCIANITCGNKYHSSRHGNVVIPESLNPMVEPITTHMNSVIAAEIYSVNDNDKMVDELRETELKRLFLEVGWVVEFIN